MTEPADKLTEEQVTRIWQRILLSGRKLAAEDGSGLEVIYPGRPNDGPGADFRDAVVSIDKEIFKGDVEIHKKSSGWYQHGHHLNPAYNRVILHVVMRNDNEGPARLENGRAVTVLALEKYRSFTVDLLQYIEPSGRWTNVPCSGMVQRQGKDAVVSLIRESGEKRFLEKSVRFGRDIALSGAGQTLYRGIMGALGYSANKQPFLELADKLPLRTLESAVGTGMSNTEYLDRLKLLLMAVSGLPPEQTGNECFDNRAEISGWLGSVLSDIQPVSSGDWRLYRIRPNNSPVHRLVAMSYLLFRYRKVGLLNGLIGLVEDLPADSSPRKLEEGIKVESLGSGRVSDIIVNVLLPFIFSWGRYYGRNGLAEKSFHIYENYPKTAINSVERHMKAQFGFSSGMVNTAAGQQGLIHIYSNLCIQGECGNCSLGNLEVGDDIEVQPVLSSISETEIAAGGNHSCVIGA